MTKFKFKTSRGEIFGEFDESKFAESECYKKPYNLRCEAKIDNEELLKEMFDYCSCDLMKVENGEIWLKVELEDTYYGFPEYLIQIIEEE